MQKTNVTLHRARELHRTGQAGLLARLCLPLVLAFAGAACTSQATTPDPKTPGSGATTEASTTPGGDASGSGEGTGAPAGNPFAVSGQLREDRLPPLDDTVIDANAVKLPAAPKGLPAPPATCGAFVKRKAPPAPACGDAAAALTALDAALAEKDEAKRDGMLAGLEACPGLPVGIARVVRIELAPLECADAIAEGVLKAPPANIKKTAYYTLLGEALAARLARTAKNAPELKAPFERKRVEEFIKGPMIAWMNDQAKIIEEIAKLGVGLPFYAQGIVAVEAGMADMRVVEVVRASPLPVEMAKDEELRNVYYASLDQGLDPRKDRGRDAALVGLKNLAFVGVIQDARVDKARALLSKLYGGRRIDALDALLLPPLAPAAPSNVEERLAAKLGTFSAGLLLDPKAGTRPGTLRALLQRGVPIPQRAALRDPALPQDVKSLYARAHLELGRLYWRASDIDQVIALTGGAAGGVKLPDDATWLRAVAIGLRNGPEDAADMMRKAPLKEIGMGQVGALDALARAKGQSAGAAAFDAALIKQIAAPQSAKAEYWKDVAARFRNAASLLPAGAPRTTAEDRAKAADEVAAAIK